MPIAPIDQPVGTATITTFGSDRIRIYRRFATDRPTLFAACFDAEMVRQWRSAPTRTVTECDIALRPGGQARMTWDIGEGRTMGITATFQDVEPPARTVRQEVQDGAPADAAVLCTVLMIPDRDGTLMTSEYWYKSNALRDAALTSQMREQTEAEFARLDAMLGA
ncbi:hypothetical protein DL237_08310 [Pseudooceanicola sediminis]|uniref:Activator of Hsp90 ATPase homologue 1/2-like C-terminal domain-containing protein n=1 Tax=Pseudooceanicola sediminis TaxID=2211117 RepID=A0A399J144_9RHOB|nr:SRPBCC domain-containing protein [Pseudooceanicola sediminis]KAA2316239.1 hypothetical protein E0K93_05165 [Puniceibacterium sp. HSS470]RII39148.1 hypothetical protein DL237_08310 [Pseudooceanicola sediminis]|tara:strand:- start:12085 stop:12579 length:495 start_codon:yes stop_codon:yes gene_type:complete